jgi:hypothetical protein
MDRVLTLVWLRSRIWMHGLRSAAGVSNLAAAILMTILVAFGSIGLTLGLSGLIFLADTADDPAALRVALNIALYTLLFFAVFIPPFVGGGRSGYHLAPLAVFPISTGALYRVSLAASLISAHHLFWYPALLGVSAVAVWTGFVPTLGVSILIVLAAVLVVWGNTTLQLAHVLVQRRSVKELLAVTAFLLLIGVSIFPAVTESVKGEGALERAFDVANLPPAVISASRLLPPSLATAALVALHEGHSSVVVWKTVWLGVWLITGLAIGYRLFSRHLLEPAPAQRSRATTAVRRPQPPIQGRGTILEHLLDRSLQPQLSALVSKELRYLTRSSPGKLNLLIAPLVAVFAGLVFAREAESSFLGIDARHTVFYGMLLYAAMLPSNFLTNAYAWEGRGVNSYFLSPVKPRTVVIAKNLAVWLFAGVLLLECLLAWGITVGIPGISVTVTGVLVFASCLLGLTIAGNLVSVLVPVRRSMSKVANSPSQVAVIAMLGTIAVTAVVTGVLLMLATMIGGDSLQPLAIVLYLTALAAAYTALLGPAADLLWDRREQLMAALEGGED